MDIPDSLREKRQTFESRGRIFRYSDELFAESSWLAVFEGQGVRAHDHEFNAMRRQ